jgi:hypothetical protein
VVVTNIVTMQIIKIIAHCLFEVTSFETQQSYRCDFHKGEGEAHVNME